MEKTTLISIDTQEEMCLQGSSALSGKSLHELMLDNKFCCTANRVCRKNLCPTKVLEK
jgi:hypothetical protein